MQPGDTFGRLTVVGDAPDKKGLKCAQVKCQCGSVFDVRQYNIKAGLTKSCGCTKKLHGLKHGYARRDVDDPTYTTWASMLQRCLNTNSVTYKDYGAVGIGVQESWRNFQTFLFEMGRRPSGTTLERMDNELGYSFANCCWASQSDQMLNTKRTVRVVHEGKTVALTKLARAAGVSPALALRRFRKGQAVSDCLKKPKQREMR